MREAHRIRRLRWRVRARSRDEAFVLRRRLRDAIGSTYVEKVNDAFDRAVPGDAVMKIPRLEVSVRVTSVEELESALVAQVMRAVAEHAGSRMVGAGSAPSTASAGETPVAEGVETLVHYLETGTVPWYAAGTDRASLLASLVEVARQSWRALLDRAPHPASDAAGTWAFFFRLLRLLPDEEWRRVAEAMAPVAHLRAGTPHWPRLMVAVTSLETASPGSYRRQRLAAAVLTAARAGAPAGNARELVETLARFAGEPTADVSALTGLPAEEAEGWGDGMWTRAIGDSVPVRPGPAVGAVATDGAQLLDAPYEVKEPPDDTAATAPAIEPFGLPVSHAGLVLLVPFLPRFFESTGLIPPAATALPAAVRPRAAALLSLAATGGDETEEFELGFIKVLVGLRPESPLPIAPGLTAPGDRQEVEALLDAVIGYWQALKRTSIDGLRTSFLSRPGLLNEDERGWRLRVEPRAYDVLLDQLPWGISTTRLPWLTTPIFTDWPTR